MSENAAIPTAGDLLASFIAACANDALLTPGRPHDYRCFKGGRVVGAACCDDPQTVIDEAVSAGFYGCELYGTLNEVAPDFAARHPLNEPYSVRSGVAGDRDIARRSQLLVDIEPVRASGTGTTDRQLYAAERLADEIAADLAARLVAVRPSLQRQRRAPPVRDRHPPGGRRAREALSRVAGPPARR